MFIIILLIILIVIYILSLKYNIFSKQENFYVCPCKSKKFKKYQYNPSIPTPQSNYNQITSNIDRQQTYKKDLTVALAPTPTIHCSKLDNLEDCNKYGCNWFATFCSSTYPTQV